MKKQLIFFHLLFMVAMMGIVWLVLAGGNYWLIFGMIFIGLVMVGMILKSWMDYLRILVNQSSQALSGKNIIKSNWSFDHLDQINKNHELIKNKFETSAQLITNLAKNEEQSSDNNLLADDPIGMALQNIRVDMNKLKEEDAKRTWINQGLAHFSEILRNKAEIKEYCHQIISHLVKYIEANQGGVYIEYTNESNERYVELSACYAYDKRKFLEKKINEGQGIIGQCMLEKELIFLTDIPNNYVNITSGLGEATPRNIVVAPLIFNEKFYGAIEIALFDVMKPHQVEFLKKVCDNIASEIASLKNIQETQILLSESNVLTQELQSSEEEMRQNIEELAATQEEMERKQSELSSVLNAIDGTLATAEFDMTGNIRSGNKIFLALMHYKEEDILNIGIKSLMGEDTQSVMMWENLRLGKFFSGEFKMKDKNGKELWLTGTFNPIMINGNEPQKVLMFAQFTTEEKEKIHDLNTTVNAFKSSMPIIVFNDEFTCKTSNKMFLDLFGLSRLNLRTKSILDLISPYYHEMWDSKKKELMKEGELNLTIPMALVSDTVIYETKFFVSRNLEGRISKIILLLIRENMDENQGESPALMTSLK
jgi:methyl-accepting chemotaxis protein